jgi:putative PIG3 family NAD(P)H quinone oxidoreductase
MRAVLPSAGAGEGGPPAPGLGELPEPAISPSEVLIAVRAAGLNRADLLQLRGLYPPPPGESEVPGLECAGVVEAVGSEVAGWAPGDRVMALLAGGGQAVKAAVPAGQLMPLPENLSFVEGAALPEACLTAWTNLVAEGGLAAGETVLVTGATGGVGTMVVQIARELGARVLAAGRSPERLEPLRELGAQALLVDAEGLARQVRDRTSRPQRGGGADLVLDLVGGALLGEHLAALRNRGRLVLVGLMAGSRAELDLGEILRRRLAIRGSVLRSRSREEKGELVAAFAAFGLPRLADGRLRPVVDRVFPFEEVAEAYRTLGEGGVSGKIVVRLARTSHQTSKRNVADARKSKAREARATKAYSPVR